MDWCSLAELLRCPLHPSAGPLVRVSRREGSADAGEEFRCAACGRVYPVVDGIPDLLVRRGPDEGFVEAEARQWDEQAPRYDEKREQAPHYMAPVEAAVDALAVQPGELVLDAGCGTGLTVRKYLRPGLRVVGLDLSLASLRYLRKALPGAPMALVRGDLQALPFPDGTFDRVLCANAIQHLPDPVARQQALRELARVARPGARVVVTAHNLSIPKKRAGWAKEGPTAGVQYIYRFEAPEFRELLRSVLVVEHVGGAGLPLPYRFKLSPLSRILERLLRRFEASAAWGHLLVGVCHKAVDAPPPQGSVGDRSS